jgi:hypothetical protein
MIRVRLHSGWLLWVACVLAIAGTAGAARAQDDEEVVEDDGGPFAAAGMVAVAAVANPDQVDQWIFGRFGGAGGARNRLDSALALRIDDLERAFGVTEGQKKKLQLAGRGDIKRFFDRVDDVKRKFVQLQNSPNNNIWQEIQPLQVELNAGIFGDDSIFTKTITRTLNDDQAARYESMLRERTSGRRRATIDWFVVHIDKGLGLSDDQRSRLGEMLVNETPAPRRFGQGDYWFLMYEMSLLPEGKLKPIFDIPQWRLLSRQFMQARGMEQWLRSNGVLANEKKGAATAVGPLRGVAPLLAPAAKIAAPRVRAQEVKK